MNLYKSDGTIISVEGGADYSLSSGGTDVILLEDGAEVSKVDIPVRPLVARTIKKNPKFTFNGTSGTLNWISRGFIYKRDFNSNSITFKWKFKITEGTSADFNIYVVAYPKDSVPNFYSSQVEVGTTSAVTPSTTETEYTSTLTNSKLANDAYGYIGIFAVIPNTCTGFEISMTDPDGWEYICPGKFHVFNGNPTIAKVQATIEQTFPIYNSRWANKSLLCCGDSTTADRYSYKEYPDYLKEALQMSNMVNNGVDSVTAISIASNLSQVLFCAGFDLVTMMIGINDAYYINGGSEELGEVQAAGSQFDRSTFCGAMQTICEYVLTNNPQGTFVLIQPNFVNQPARENVLMTQITPALEAITQLYRIPFIKTRPCINAMNHTLFLTDGLHFSDEGEQHFSAFLASAIAAI